MSLSGNINTFPLTDLLQWFSITRKTGVLSVVAGKDTINIFFRRGALIAADSTAASRRIGQYLLSRGYITESQLKKALDAQEDYLNEKLLGNILCDQGILTRENLTHALHSRTEEIIYDLFLLSEGVFYFDQGAEFPESKLIVDLNLSIDNLVLEGVRRSDEWKRFRRGLPSDQVRLKLCRSGDEIPDGTDELGLIIFDLLNEEKSISELIMMTRRSSYQVYASTFNLLQKQCIEIGSAQSPKVEKKEKKLDNNRQLEEDFFQLIGAQDFEQARGRIEELQKQSRDHEWMQKMKSWINQEEMSFLQQRLPNNGIPVLTISLTEARNLELGPQEGFLLSRLGEGMDVKSLCQVMPLAEHDILRILFSLEKRGVVRL